MRSQCRTLAGPEKHGLELCSGPTHCTTLQPPVAFDLPNVSFFDSAVKQLGPECTGARRMELPQLALSVRQPWAWAIIHAGKDIENRSWQATNHGLRQRGRIAIHAAKGMTKDEYWEAREFIDRLGYTCPDPHALWRGGIIGSVDVVDVVSQSDSPWFFGPRGLVLANPTPHAFVGSAGQLGYFVWTPNGETTSAENARWMVPQPPKLTETVRAMQPLPLFPEASQ